MAKFDVRKYIEEKEKAQSSETKATEKASKATSAKFDVREYIKSKSSTPSSEGVAVAAPVKSTNTSKLAEIDLEYAKSNPKLPTREQNTGFDFRSNAAKVGVPSQMTDEQLERVISNPNLEQTKTNSEVMRNYRATGLEPRYTTEETEKMRAEAEAKDAETKANTEYLKELYAKRYQDKVANMTDEELNAEIEANGAVNPINYTFSSTGEKFISDTKSMTPKSEKYERNIISAYSSLSDEAKSLISEARELDDVIGNRTYNKDVTATLFDKTLQTSLSKNSEVKRRLAELGYSDELVSELVAYDRILENEKKAKQEATEIEGLLSGELFWANAASVPANMTSILGQADITAQTWRNRYSKNFRPVDYYTPSTVGGRYSREVRKETSERIDNPVVDFIYNTGMSIADSATSAMIGGQYFAPIILSGSAGLNTIYDAKERGLSDMQAVNLGLAASLNEALFEKISIDKFFEGLNNKEAKKFIVQIFTQAVPEGLEEVGTSLANQWADTIIAADKSQFGADVSKYMQDGKTEEEAKALAARDFFMSLGLDFLGGFFSGGVFGTVQAVANKVSSKGNTQTETPKMDSNTAKNGAQHNELLAEINKSDFKVDSVYDTQYDNYGIYLYPKKNLSATEASRLENTLREKLKSIPGGKEFYVGTVREKDGRYIIRVVADRPVLLDHEALFDDVTLSTAKSAAKEKAPTPVKEAETATGFGKYGAELVADIANSTGATLDEVSNAVKTAYMAGRTDLDISKASLETETQIKAFTAGKQDALMQNIAAKEEAKNATVYDWSVESLNDDERARFDKLSKEDQKQHVQVAKDLGLRLSFVERLVANVVDGEVYEANAQHEDGVYTRSETSQEKAHVDIVHEVLHRMKQLAPEATQELINEIYRFTEEHGSVVNVSMLESIKAELKNAGINANTADALEELGARVMPVAFKNAEDWNAWRKKLDSDSKLRRKWDKFISILKEIIEKAKRAIAQINMTAEEIEQSEAKARAMKELEHIKELYANAYRAARDVAKEKSQTRQTAEALDDVGVQIDEGSSSVAPKKMFSLKETNSHITENDSDSRRTQILLKKSIVAPIYNGQADSAIKTNEKELNSGKIDLVKTTLVSIGKQFGIIGENIVIDDVDVEITLSKSNLRESVSKKATPTEIAKLLPILSESVSNAIGIERHNNRYYYDSDTVFFENLLGGYVDGEYFVPVRFGLKHSKSGKATLYVVVDQNKIPLKSLEQTKKTEVVKGADPIKTELTTSRSVKYRIPQIIPFVKSKDLLRYIPDNMLNNEQKTAKWEAISETVIYTAKKNDKHYAKFIKEGKLQAANEMVHEAAKANGYTVKAYHGTGADFNIFSEEKVGGRNVWGKGFYFGTSKGIADDYASWRESKGGKYRIVSAYLKMDNPFIPYKSSLGTAEEILDRWFSDMWKTSRDLGIGYIEGKIENSPLDLLQFIAEHNNIEVRDVLAEYGYDSVKSDGELVVFKPEQIKSADVITYDDNDNIIPISERFNEANKDIRFSLKDTKLTTSVIADILDAAISVESGDTKAITKLEKYVDSGLIPSEKYSELADKYGVIYKGEKPYRDVEVPKKTAKDKKVSQTVRTILESEATPDEALPTIEKMVEDGVFSYDVYTDKQAIADAEETVKKNGWTNTYATWLKEVTRGAVSKQNTVLGWALYNNAVNTAATTTDADAKKRAMTEALSILDAMVEHQRNAAQALQATRVLKKLSPETQLYGIKMSVKGLQEKLVNKYGKKAPELKIDEKLAADFLAAETNEDRNLAAEEIYKDIGRQMPSDWLDKWNAWRYLAMLGNARTHVRNVVGNAGFAPVVAVKNLTATAIESFVYRVSGKKMLRGKALITGSKADKALLKAAWSDYNNVADIVSEGGKYNDTISPNKYIEKGRRVFKRKLPEALRRGNSWLLDKEDAWFAQPHYAYALAQYCKANNITPEQIARGKAIDPARAYAIKEAQKATYRDTNWFSQIVSGIGRGGKNKALGALVEGILPFRKTPANILARGVEYSPIGFLKSLSYDIVRLKNGDITATELIDNISAGLTGTGLLFLGRFLARLGLIRGHGEDDEKQKEFKEMMGHQSYSLEVGGQSFTLDWLAPEALPFFVGVNIWEQTGKKDEKVNLSTILQAVSGISEPMMEMSFLQGINDVFENIGYASSGDTSALTSVLSSAATSYLLQGVPTLLGQFERTGEENRMTTYTEKNDFLTGDMQYTLGKLFSKIPLVDYQQIPYIDAWGRKEASGTALKRGLNNFLNPSYNSTIEESKMEKELLRLFEQTGEASVFPQRADKYFTVDGKRKDLTAEEYVKYATLKGEKSYKLVTDLVKSEAYKKLSDADKAKAIEEAYDLANQKAKQAVSNYKPEKWVATAESFGDNAGNYLAFKSDVSTTRKENGNKISKSEIVDIISDYSQSDDETWKMYLSMYDSKNDLEAKKYDIDVDRYLEAIVMMDKIKPDYKKNGDVISGSRREKIERYLKTICKNSEEYYFLLGTQYDSIKDDAPYLKYVK